MSVEVKKEIELEIAYVLFIDIVGYSKIVTHEQRRLLELLNRIVRDALDGAVAPLEHPVLEDLQVLRRSIGALEHVAVDEAARAEEGRHPGRDAGRHFGVRDPLEGLRPLLEASPAPRAVAANSGSSATTLAGSLTAMSSSFLSAS